MRIEFIIAAFFIVINTNDSQISVHWDQDILAFGKNEDRNYTQGLEIGYNSNKLSEIKLFSKQLRNIANCLHFSRKEWSIDNDRSLSLGNVLFTPDSLNNALVNRLDRPYSGFTYLKLSTYFFDGSETNAVLSSINVGFLGSNIGNVLQTAIHFAYRAINGGSAPYDPLGWHNQIGTNKITPTFMYHLEMRKAASSQNIRLAGRIDYGLDIGTYQANLLMSFSGRIGILGRPKENILHMNYNYIGNVNGILKAKSIRTTIERERKMALYAIVYISPKLVFYNQALSGMFVRDSPHTIDEKKIVLSSGIGFGIDNIGKKKLFEFKYIYNFRTPEFRTIDYYTRFHKWGSLIFSWKFM